MAGIGGGRPNSCQGLLTLNCKANFRRQRTKVTVWQEGPEAEAKRTKVNTLKGQD